MTIVHVTAFYTGLLALVLLVLSIQVISVRRRLRIGIGDEGNEELARRIRAQGNFTEYVPLALLLMLAGELAAAPVWMLHGLGATLVIGRCVHAWSLPARSTAGRTAGMLLTFAVIVAGAALAIAAAFAVFPR